jgi:hypothetical protein
LRDPEAGAGSVTYAVDPHYLPHCERTSIYGQVVDAERIGGPAAHGLDPSVCRVVLVPWDHLPDCRTTWT